MTSNSTSTLSEFIHLDRRFSEVFREPAIIDLVCQKTNQKIRKMNSYSKATKNPATVMWWAFVTMAGTSPKDLHPPGNDSKMSINAHITMNRWVLAMVRDKCKEIKENKDREITYITPIERKWEGYTVTGLAKSQKQRVVVCTHPTRSVKHRKAGGVLLHAERQGWLAYAERLEETLEELLRLRTLLQNGWCDGDNA